MTELKPCPFCGGQPTAIETHMGRGELYCGTCDVVMGGNEAKTPEELTEAWNTRAERTCHDKNGFTTTNAAGELLGFECTNCGAMVDTYMMTTTSLYYQCLVQFRYCPNCGAKVVDE